MNALVDVIQESMAMSSRLGHTLKAVSIAAPLGSDSAALRLVWSGYGSKSLTSSHAGVTETARTSPADTITEMNHPNEIDIIEAAWLYGAPDMARWEFRPLAPGQDPHDMRYGLTRQFSGMCYQVSIGSAWSDINISIDDGKTSWMIEAAAKNGFLTYRFKPGFFELAGRQLRVNDPSLDEDGFRRSPLPPGAAPQPLGLPDPTAAGHEITWSFSDDTKLIHLEEWLRRYRASNCATALGRPGDVRSALANQYGGGSQSIGSHDPALSEEAKMI